MICTKCSNRINCKKPCEYVEKNFLKFGYSIKSNYIVKFFRQEIMENVLLKSKFNNYKYERDETDYFEIVNSNLKFLTDKQRECIILYYGLDDGIGVRSQIKVAKQLHISQHSVYRHLKNAKKRLKNSIKLNI